MGRGCHGPDQDWEEIDAYAINDHIPALFSRPTRYFPGYYTRLRRWCSG